MPQMTDLTGRRYGRYTVVKYAGRDKRNAPMWMCQCDCGNIKNVLGSSLTRGQTKSCGCYNKDRVKETHTKHGQYKTRIYSIYAGMIKRCRTKTIKSYKDYGGRGIKVCDEWLGKDGFINFYNWSMANGYSDNLSIDRINNDGNYEPSNCRWTDAKTQGNNTRWNRNITIDGETHTLSQWAEISNVSRDLIRDRIKRGWDVKEAIFTQPNTKFHRFNISGYRYILKNENKNKTTYTVLIKGKRKTFSTLNEALEYREKQILDKEGIDIE